MAAAPQKARKVAQVFAPVAVEWRLCVTGGLLERTYAVLVSTKSFPKAASKQHADDTPDAHGPVYVRVSFRRLAESNCCRHHPWSALMQ